MPTLERPGATLFYEDTGSGTPIITTHGFLETAAYWSLGGVAGRLSLSHRVVSMDMRCHARTTRTATEPTATLETIADDIEALADHLGFDRFHLLTHATGGMAGVRYAMHRSQRLLSLVLTSTASATVIGDPAGYDIFASTLENGTWPSLHDTLNEMLSGFLPKDERQRALVRDMYQLNNPQLMGQFVREFYNDANPRVDLLHQIECPTLVLVGSDDTNLLGPSRLMASEIAQAELVELPGVGHMTAIEAPGETGDALMDLLGSPTVLARLGAPAHQ
jgi:pimeloyl-ACP methyl ester carboxylesterase